MISRNLGWAVAAGVVLILLIVILIWALSGSSTPATVATTGSGRLDRIAQPASLWEIVGQPKAAGLAADDYNKGVVEYLDSNRYAALNKMSDEQKLSIQPAKFPYKVCRFLQSGTAKKQMSYFSQYVSPAQAVKPSHAELSEAAQSDSPPIFHLVAFPEMAKAALLYAKLCEKHHDARDAERTCKAVLLFGWHISEDRVRLRGVQIGLQIQQMAAEQLKDIYDARGEKAKAEKVTAYLDSLAKVIEATDRKARETVFKLSASGRLQVGDLLNIAAKDSDPMWRIEATHQLGLCRALKGQSRSDQKAIESLLANLKNQTDPMIKAAAEFALTMTPEEARSAR